MFFSIDFSVSFEPLFLSFSGIFGKSCTFSRFFPNKLDETISSNFKISDDDAGGESDISSSEILLRLIKSSRFFSSFPVFGFLIFALLSLNSPEPSDFFSLFVTNNIIIWLLLVPFEELLRKSFVISVNVLFSAFFSIKFSTSVKLSHGKLTVSRLMVMLRIASFGFALVSFNVSFCLLLSFCLISPFSVSFFEF